MKAIVHITRPELTHEEMLRRIEVIKQATANLIIATETEKRRKKKDA